MAPSILAESKMRDTVPKCTGVHRRELGLAHTKLAARMALQGYCGGAFIGAKGWEIVAPAAYGDGDDMAKEKGKY